MKYNELTKIAKTHIRESENVPFNSLLLLSQLHIPCKTESQCKADFDSKMNPLYDKPAFLFIDSENNKTIYFNSNTRYWNFYIFHEIAHYLLGHETNSSQNELDADMLACILIAPVQNLPSYLKSATDLSYLCSIPIDKAEMYWNEIKSEESKNKYSLFKDIILAVLASIIFSIIFSLIDTYYFSETPLTQTQDNYIYIDKKSEQVQQPTTEISKSQMVVVTVSGKKYHLPTCHYVKNKENIVTYNINDAINKNYSACEICLKDKS